MIPETVMIIMKMQFQVFLIINKNQLLMKTIDIVFIALNNISVLNTPHKQAIPCGKLSFSTRGCANGTLRER
jgi:hypothetical protein